MHSPETRVPELDGVRAVACLLVLVLHCIVGLLPTQAGTAVHDIRIVSQIFLAGGVDLFFVLSGFLIGGILLDNRDADNVFKVFWTRRITRIFPVYYLLVVIYGALLLLPTSGPSWFQSFQYDNVPFWAYASFTQNIAMAVLKDGGNGFLGVTWSLAVEEQFYLILPFIVVFLPRRWLISAALAAVVVAPLIRAYVWQNVGFHWAYILLPCRMDTLMWGVLAACAIRSEGLLLIVRRHRGWFDLMASLSFLSIALQIFPTMAEWLAAHVKGYPNLLIITLQYSSLAWLLMWLVLRVFAVDRDRSKYRAALCWEPLRIVGLLSYSAYMFHQIINTLVHGLIHGSPHLSGWEDFYIPLLVFGITFALAVLSFRFIEQPVRGLGQRVKYKPSSQPLPLNNMAVKVPPAV